MLTEEQINRLYKFCAQHFVRYYDVQVELVDHLANAIEAKMHVDKNVAFEVALDSVYVGFGRMGFSKIITQKTEAANKQIRNMRWQYFKNYFTIPKITAIVLFTAILASLYFVISKNNLVFVFIGLTLICMAIVIGFMIHSSKIYKKPEKKLLCLENINWYFSISILFQIPNCFNFLRIYKNNIGAVFSEHPVYYFVFIIVCVSFILLSFASIKTYIKIQEDARKNYPLAFL